MDKVVFVNEPLWISALYKIMNNVGVSASLRNRLQVCVGWRGWVGRPVCVCVLRERVGWVGWEGRLDWVGGWQEEGVGCEEGGF